MDSPAGAASARRSTTRFDQAIRQVAPERVAQALDKRSFFDIVNKDESIDDSLAREMREKSLYRVVIDGDDGGTLLRDNAAALHRAVEFRVQCFSVAQSRRSFDPSLPQLRKQIAVTWRAGVPTHPDLGVASAIVSYPDMVRILEELYLTVESGVMIRTCQQRLSFVQEISKMTTLLNVDIEANAGLARPGGVFADAIRVDNSVHASRATPARDLLDIVTEHFEKTPHEPITKRPDGTNVTLADLVADAKVPSPSAFTVAGLGWIPKRGHTSAQFDLFTDGTTLTSKFSAAVCRGALRPEGGLYPVLIKKLLQRLDSRASRQAAEFRIAIIGDRPDEVFQTCKMFKSNNLTSSNHRAMWFFRVGFHDYVDSVRTHRERARKLAEAAAIAAQRALRKQQQQQQQQGTTAQQRAAAAAAAAEAATVDIGPKPKVLDFLRNIFQPLLDASLRPDEGGGVAWMLAQLGGIHIESRCERAGRPVVPPRDMPSPDLVDFDDPRVTDTYIDYHIWCAVTVINTIRSRSKLNPLQIRRSIGGAAGLGTIVSGYLFADVLCNAAVLDAHPVLQYLVGIHRVGVTVSPLMNNLTGIPYQSSPVAKMFHRSLKIAIATEQPMQYHCSSDPLTEETATAQKLLGLTGRDLAEISRNSVRISSFRRAVKEEWLGEGRTHHLGHMSKYRSDFREEVWRNETILLASTSADVRAGGKEGESVALWAKLSTVTDDEYFSIRDKRVRFPRTLIVAPPKQSLQRVVREAAAKIVQAVRLRDMYIWKPQKPFVQRAVSFEEALQRNRKQEWSWRITDSVFIACKDSEVHVNWPSYLCTLEQFSEHLKQLKSICDDINVKDFCYRRLELLDLKFRLHVALNAENEAGSSEGAAGLHNRDFFRASKVDTHIHMAAGMTGRHLRQFIIDKLDNSPDDIVGEQGGVVQTFGRLAKQMSISRHLTVDQLNVQADHTLFERFDNFNNHYNPMAKPGLRTLLLKTENYMNGRYFAEIINQTFADYAKDKYTFAENRLSIYGMNRKEWDSLASWFDTHGMASKHNKWIIQMPRVYKGFREANKIVSFGQYIENIFEPLWQVSLEPHKNPKLHNFLLHVSGFDSVDNEATIDPPFQKKAPWEWTAAINPPYNYYMYHLWVNIRTLNEFRESQNLSTFSLRPHCGESGSDEHLIGAFLTADAINHGINLRNDPSLQYLYYIAQVGLAVSPLSNNALFLYFLKNPFDTFFRRGLNVSLSTDDPLMFHQTREPLIEEYSIAAKVWNFTMNDLCELAKNSVLQSGFNHEWKAEKLGRRFYFSSSLGNDPNMSHMSNIRQAYRFEAYHSECAALERFSADENQKVAAPLPRFMTTVAEENKFVALESVPHQVVLVRTQNEAMERLQRDIVDRRERIAKTKSELEDAARQHARLLEQVAAAGARIRVFEDELVELDKPAPKAEVSYSSLRAGRGGGGLRAGRGGRGGANALIDIDVPNPKPAVELWQDFLKTDEQRARDEEAVRQARRFQARSTTTTTTNANGGGNGFFASTASTAHFGPTVTVAVEGDVLAGEDAGGGPTAEPQPATPLRLLMQQQQQPHSTRGGAQRQQQQQQLPQERTLHYSPRGLLTTRGTASLSTTAPSPHPTAMQRSVTGGALTSFEVPPLPPTPRRPRM